MLGKVVRLVGILGGLGALAWTMRDRFISLAVPREPQPPTFRVVPSLQDAGEDLTLISGIGPVYAARLRNAGFTTLALVAAADPERLGEAAGVPTARAEPWVAQAKAPQRR